MFSAFGSEFDSKKKVGITTFLFESGDENLIVIFVEMETH
jgi:hypothetical protein